MKHPSQMLRPNPPILPELGCSVTINNELKTQLERECHLQNSTP